MIHLSGRFFLMASIEKEDYLMSTEDAFSIINHLHVLAVKNTPGTSTPQWYQADARPSPFPHVRSLL